MECIFCDRETKNGAYCQEHYRLVESERAKAKAQKQKGDWWRTALHYFHYQGIVIGVFRNGDKGLVTNLIHKPLEKLPKGKVYDLDHYCDGFDRHQIKKIKAHIRALAKIR